MTKNIKIRPRADDMSVEVAIKKLCKRLKETYWAKLIGKFIAKIVPRFEFLLKIS